MNKAILTEIFVQSYCRVDSIYKRYISTVDTSVKRSCVTKCFIDWRAFVFHLLKFTSTFTSIAWEGLFVGDFKDALVINETRRNTAPGWCEKKTISRRGKDWKSIVGIILTVPEAGILIEIHLTNIYVENCCSGWLIQDSEREKGWRENERYLDLLVLGLNISVSVFDGQ